MAKIKLNGDTSGYIEISAPAVSGNNTLELGPGTRILTNLDNTFTGISTFSNGIHITSGGFTLNQQRNDTHASLIIDKPDAGTGTLKFFNNGSASAYIQHTGAEHLHYYLPSGSGYHAFYTNGSNERLRILSTGTVNIGDQGLGSEYLSSTVKIRKDQNSVTRVSLRNENSGSGSASAIQLGAYGNSWMLQCGSTANDSNAFTIRVDGSANSNTGIEKLRITTAGQLSLRGNTTAFDGTGGLDALQMYYETDSGQASIGPYSSGGSTHLSFYTNSGGAAATEKVRIQSGGNVLLGNTTGASTASPVNLSLGGTYSNSGGQNPKLNLWDNGTEYMSLGVSSNQMDFMMSMDDYDFVWYGQNDSNNGPEERMRLDNSEKLLDFAGTCKIRVRGGNNPGTTHAHLNIGSDGGASTDTRAIDIWGNWSDQESKSITWAHGTTNTSDIVCQQRVRYNSSPSTSVYEIGRFFNGQNTTAFPFKLQSTSTTTADLTVDGNVLHKTAAFVARSTSSNNITSTTRQKIDYTVDYSYDSVFNNTNDRFTCTKAGLYFFYARHWFGSNSSGTIYLDWMKNGALVKEFRVTHPSSSGEYESIQGSGMIYMAVNDYLEVYGRSDGNGVFHESNGAAYSEFSGFYVSGG